VKLGSQNCLYLGNLDARRDWGHARDYVEMQWIILQQDIPEDYVVATGVQYSVRDFVDATAATLDMKIRWEGKGVDEKGIDVTSGRPVVAVDPRYFRPTEVDSLLGNAEKARKKLGWQPRTTFQQLVREMAEEDFKLAQRDAMVKKAGFKAFNYFE
jgi:GDPmannose 4,6-dehydratase